MFALFLTGKGSALAGVDPVKLMSYNLLNYPATSSFVSDTTLRNPFFRTIIGAANPDILVVQELRSDSGYIGFLNNVMNKALSGFAAGTYVAGSLPNNDTKNGIYYRTSKFSFISNTAIRTDANGRDINEFKLKHLLSGDTIRIYSVHLKASSGATNEAQRAEEIDSLRKVTNALPLGSNFVICGDFNIYKDGESAYIKLKQVATGKEGHFLDPLNLTGTWNDTIYRAFHTQSTRIVAFGGGSTNGLDDRFDMILYSKALSIPGGVDFSTGSMIQFGNDGMHYNQAINFPANTAVSAAVADALYNASDHIPVIATLNFNYNTVATNDFGVLNLVSPTGNICPNAAQQMQVQIKNFGASTIDFSSTNLPLELKVINPAAVTQTFNKTITSGTLAANGTLNVTFDTPLNMTLSGAYSFKSYTQINQDINHANDTNSTQANVYSINVPVISPAGPLSICNSSPVLLTSSAAVFYSWSNGSTTNSILVASTGNYFVTTTDAHGCLTTSTPVVVTVDSFRVSGVLYNETFGVPTGTTSISSYTGWRNGPPITYTSTSSTPSDVRKTNPSALVNLSDTGNIFMGFATNGDRNFIISGINTIGYQNLKLSFGLRRESTGTDTIKVAYSDNGGSFLPFSFTQLSVSNSWFMVNATANIPVTSNLIIQFSKNSLTTQFRIDDVSLTYNYYSPIISAGSATTFCAGGNVSLNGTPASGYLWSNGAITQNINVTASGSYSVVQTSANGCTAISNIIPVTVNPILTPFVSMNALPTGSICSGTSVTFTATPTNGGLMPIYNFKVNNISKQNGANNTYVTSALFNGDSVICEMTSNANCASPVVAISIKYYATVLSPPTWFLDYDNDGFYKDGSAITQCNNPGNGYTTLVTAGGDCNDSNALVKPGIAEICGNGIDDNCNGQVDEGCSVTLNLKLFIEGFYIGNGMMIMSDTITVELHNAFAPFTIYTVTGVISEFGVGSFVFPLPVLNTNCYIVIRHRNSIETWSKTPVFFNSNVKNFDFTTP